MTINSNTIPILKREIIIRDDTNGKLLFQVYTDEMYLVSQQAFESIIIKCNGSQTINEIIEEMNCDDSTGEKKTKVENLIEELYKRELIQVW